MPLKSVGLGCLLSIACLLSASGQDVTREIFMVSISLPGDIKVFQTGFRMKGYHGIFTTIHGLSGGGYITAGNGSNETYDDLQIRQVDLIRDIALLSNQQLDALPLTTGIPLATSNPSPLENLHSYGHPYGIALHPRDHIPTTNPPLKPLSSIIPPDELGSYQARRSPDPGIHILDLELNFGNGESGAPILNGRDEVIGIHDGGFDNIGISWAIPARELAMTANFNMAQILRLSGLRVGKLHSAQIDVEATTGKRIDDLAKAFEDWYFSLVKLSQKVQSNQQFNALDLFDKNTLSSRMQHVLDVSPGQYAWFGDIFEPPLSIGQHPLEFIPVNVVHHIAANTYEYTVYFRYNTAFYMYKQRPTPGGIQLASDYQFSFDYDYIKGLSNLISYTKINVQAVFVLDNQNKLMDVVSVKTVSAGDPFFQSY